ncbi:hypothetical protein JW992_07465 [candidate division KSB1 bacterium]|nr:hypothetical protein [candidate division KSB1 bacterium]
MKKTLFSLFLVSLPLMAQQQKIVIDCPTRSAEEFGQLADLAVEIGATHVVVSHLPKSRWQWELDRNDPYPNWNMHNPALFKIIVPRDFSGLLPQDSADRNLAIVRQRAQVLHSHNLKAAMRLCEPAWLPEAVWEKYPEWRGPRCEHPRRARNKYYSPCVDRPEILEIYQRTFRQLCTVVPVESIDMLTNDSGGGFCWSASLYPGVNGPVWCESRSYAERVVGFLHALQQGAREAGIESEISVHYGSGQISRAEVVSVVSHLEPGQAINGQTRTGRVLDAAVGYGYYTSAVNPVRGIPQPIRFVESLDRAFRLNEASVKIQMTEFGIPEHLQLLRNYSDEHGLLQRAELLHRTAAEMVGESQAADLVQVWEEIDHATKRIINLVGDPIMIVGVVNQRWLNRPFVPFPMELTAAQKSIYRPFQFQANSEKDAADLMNLQGFEIINGYSGSLLARTAFEQSISHVSRAIEGVDALNLDVDRGLHFRRLGERLRVLRCCYRTAKHAIQYQDILDRTDYDNPPVEENIYPVEGDQKLRELQVITRAEVDNMIELIGLIERDPGFYIELAQTESEEDIFTYGPKIVEQLREKIRIMLDRELDANRLYIRRQG